MSLRPFSFSTVTATTGTPGCSSARPPPDFPPTSTSSGSRSPSICSPDFDDLRHGAGHPTRPMEGNHALLLEATLAATHIVSTSAVHGYALASHTKHYLDHWTSWMYIQDPDFRAATAGRTVWGVTTVRIVQLADDRVLMIRNEFDRVFRSAEHTRPYLRAPRRRHSATNPRTPPAAATHSPSGCVRYRNRLGRRFARRRVPPHAPAHHGTIGGRDRRSWSGAIAATG